MSDGLMDLGWNEEARSSAARRKWTSALTLSLAWFSCGDQTAPSGPATPAAPSAASAPATSGAVTLITGDRVTVRRVDGGRAMAQVTPGPGRAQLSFSIEEKQGELTVIPEDMRPLLGSGQLDRALFNVTKLLHDGYGDAELDHLPLIVTGAGTAQAVQAQLASASVSIERALPALGMLAVKHRKGNGAAMLAELTRPARAGGSARKTAPMKLWLDRRLSLSLDQSVAQIGGPAAHARGLTGTGITVAVLDTGIDATHPDLAGKVALAESFVDDGLGNTDPHGHGTHVASTIAGSGAASGGQRRGVAPGASLLAGRVCYPTRGCPESAILAGMEWAVANGAQIVNLSLGSFDTPEIDPLEAAVNQLSAQYGTLFVVAAGNFGEPLTVGSPSSADAALSVGAVDRLDRLALFSSQGPRTGDHAIKPDLTAPGSGIVAARATGTSMGAPVDGFYTRANGTSMATPHVSGAAALLLQQHPTWSGGRLKAALMGAAQPSESLSVFAQGAGRLDIDRATRQALSAEPASLSLGTASFPHDDDPLLVRTVRYYNRGTEPVTLALSASLTGGRLGTSPAGMIRVAPTSLVVPAGGFAEAEVTVDTSVPAADDLYGGALLATADGLRLRTPVGVDREGESHGLTISVVDSQGQPGTSWVTLQGLGSPADPTYGVRIDQVVSGQATFRLPVGTYLLEALDFYDDVYLVAPRVTLAAEETLVVDGTLARPLQLTLPEEGYSIDQTVLSYVDTPSGTGSFLISPRQVATAHLGPSVAPGQFHSTLSVTMIPPETPAASVYHLASSLADRFPTGWAQTFQRADLAKVQSQHAGAAGNLLQKTTAAFPLAGGVTAGHALPPSPGPFQRSDYYYGPDHLWYSDLAEGSELPGLPGFLDPISIIDSMAEYLPGRRYHETWNQAPFGPGFAARTLFAPTGDLVGAPQRYFNRLVLAPSLFGDQATPVRNNGSLMDEGSLKLFRDGQLLDETEAPAPLMLFPLMPAERATYRLEASGKRPPERFELSAEVHATWTFQAEGGAENRLYSLPTLRFQPALDEHHRTGARGLLLPIAVERPPGAPTPDLATLSAEASFDDGATWTRLPLWRDGSRAVAFVWHPRGATYVSLRGATADVEGNAVEQTILRAYALK